MKLKPGILILVTILIITAAILINSAGFRRFDTKLLPMIVAGTVFFLAAIEVVRELRGKNTGPVTSETDPDAPTSKYPARRYLFAIGWLVGFFIAIYLVGFVISIPLFMISYLKSRGRRWPVTIIITALVTIISYVVFTYLLGITLYPGLIFQLLDI